MPEDLPDRMPEDMLEHMPEDMPDRMSDRLPEDLRVRKCINVMVGITRSKVIQFIARASLSIVTHSKGLLPSASSLYGQCFRCTLAVVVLIVFITYITFGVCCQHDSAWFVLLLSLDDKVPSF